MKKLFSPRIFVSLAITAALLIVSAAFSNDTAAAAGNTFNLMVEHAINGKDLGLDKDLPVNVFINGNLAIEGFRFGETVNTSLPAGTYKVTVAMMDGTPLRNGVGVPNSWRRKGGPQENQCQHEAGGTLPRTNDHQFLHVLRRLLTSAR